MAKNIQSKITVSIISGKSSSNLVRCLTSLPQAASSTAIDVWVIDNRAKWNMAEVIKKYYPGARVIKNQGLKGFGANHNQVLKTLQTDYALVLNDDIQMGERCIDLMCQFMATHPEVGLAGAALYERSWQGLHQTGGGLLKSLLPPPIKILLVTLTKALDLYQYVQKYVGHKKIDITRPLELSFVSGACMMVRKRVLDQIGLFDEGFYMYFEDVDLGKRAQQAGWQCYQVPGAKIVHTEAASASNRLYRWVAQSAQHYARKHHFFISYPFICLLALFLKVTAVIKTKSFNQKNMLAVENLHQPNIQQPRLLKLLFMADAFILGFSRYFFEACQYLVKQGHQIAILGSNPDKHIPKRRTVDRARVYQYYLEESRVSLNPVRIIFKMLFYNYRFFDEIQRTFSLDGIVFWQPLSALGVRLHPGARHIPKAYFFLCPWHKEHALNVGLADMAKLTPKYLWHYVNMVLRKYLERLMIRDCRRIMVLSDFARNELLETHPISPSRIAIVPGAIDTTKYKPLEPNPELRNRLNIPQDKFVLLTVRRLVPRMGLEHLIKAMPLILKANPRAYLIIVGDGPLMNPLKELSHSLGLKNAVRFEGLIYTDKLPAYYNAVDLFILPTKSLEGFGYVTIEAMACGTPALGTPIGGTKEILGKFNPALLFKGTTPEDIADLIIKFSRKSLQELEEIGRQGRDFVLKNYTWAVVGPKIERVCQSIIQTD